MLSLTTALLGIPVGCSALEDVQGYFQSLVTETVALGVAEPTAPELDLSQVPALPQRGSVASFLADATSVNDLSNALVSGVEARFRVGQTGAITLVEESDGTYRAPDGFTYTEGEIAYLTFEDADAFARTEVALPRPADLSAVSTTHEAGQPLALDFTDREYYAVIVLVADVGTGELTFVSPDWIGSVLGDGALDGSMIRDLYDFTHADEPVQRLEVPGTAFAAESLYALGVAGMLVAEPESYEELNTALSSFMAGQMVFTPIDTLPKP